MYMIRTHTLSWKKRACINVVVLVAEAFRASHGVINRLDESGYALPVVTRTLNFEYICTSRHLCLLVLLNCNIKEVFAVCTASALRRL